jgi:hypothetical protein
MVANAKGVDTGELTVPVVGVPAANAPAVAPRADAGDDQVALVGRRVNLSGALSEPRGQIAHRWIQMGGPKVRLSFDEGAMYSFIPHVPGVYRFALVVASCREISQPHEVTVSVASSSASIGASVPAPGESETTPELARRVLSSVRGGPDGAVNLAEVFDAIADRMDLYQSYAEMFQEMSRRLETVVPAEPGLRDLWTSRVFTPLTSRLIELMLTEGLDLRRPDGQNAELSLGQRARLAEGFREVAEGFRAAKSSR